MQSKVEYSSQNIAKLEEHLSLSYSPVEIRPLGSYENFGFNGTVNTIGHVTLELFTAVGSYEIKPVAPMDATMFVIVMDNQIAINSKISDLHLAKGMATVYHHPVDVQLRDGSQQLSLIVPDNVLQRRLAHVLDGRAGRPLRFDNVALPENALRQFAAAVQSLPASPIVQLAEGVPSQSSGLEDFIVDSLILNFPNNNSDFLSNAPQISPRQVKRALEFIHSAPHRHISPVTLADVSGVSTRALQYAFKKATGRTITEYQTALRIEMACKEILKSAHRSIEDIARSLGFSSPSNFSQVFKKIYGVSPKQFREMHF